MFPYLQNFVHQYNVLMNILIDASALLPILIDKPEKKHIIHLTRNCSLLAPFILPLEIGNALTRLHKRRILNEQEVAIAFNDFKKIPLRLVNAEIETALSIACRYALNAGEAYYLEIAVRLNLPFLTLDRSLKKAAADLKLRLLGEQK